MKILFINPLFCQPGHNAAGIAGLRGYLEAGGITTAVIDFNRVVDRSEKYARSIAALRDHFISHIPPKITSRILKRNNNDIFWLSASFIEYLTSHGHNRIIHDSLSECSLFDDLFGATFSGWRFQYAGISVGYSSQIYFSLLAAHYIKKLYGDRVKIAAGGPFVTHNVEGLKIFLQDNPVIDYVIAGEGQTALGLLMAQDAKPGDIPNLIYRDQDNNYKSAVNQDYSEDYLKLPPPLYEPDDIPCIRMSRKCYWNKCTFCRNYDATFEKPSKRLSAIVDKTIENLKIIKVQIKEPDPIYYFLDSAILPAQLKLFSQKIIADTSLPRNFRAFLRLDPSLDYGKLSLAKQAGFGRKKGGKMIFGLETASARLQGIINKGISISSANQIIDNCSELGLNIQINIIYELPTETEDELKNDLNFAFQTIKNYPDNTLITFVFFPFHLVAGSAIHIDPERYRIEPRLVRAPLLSRNIPFVKTDKGNTPLKSAKKIIETFIENNHISNNVLLY